MKGDRLGKVSSLVLAVGSLLSEAEALPSSHNVYQPFRAYNESNVLADSDFSADHYIVGSILGLAVLGPLVLAGYILDRKKKS